MEKSRSFGWSVGFNVGYGPLSGGIQYSESYSINDAKFYPVYDGEDDYPFEHEADFTNTKLKEEGSFYIIEHKINHNENTGTEDKRMYINWRAPHYETFNGDYLDTKNSYLFLDYYSN